jgi:hypothetical protein
MVKIIYIYFTADNILLQMLAEDNSAGSVVDANYNVDNDNEVELNDDADNVDFNENDDNSNGDDYDEITVLMIG